MLEVARRALMLDESLDTIAKQEEHHRKRTYAEEYEMFVKRYGLEWQSEKNH